ncbi:MAG: RluA family pseudouridine synthase [Gammaproteobacteria bacterium]|nr:MAG: RluA family pseudouridine synthase [Gammaproteobacteria bacterium]
MTEAKQKISRQLQVPAIYAGQRVDKAAAELFIEFSRANLSRWIRCGDLTVDDNQVKPKAKLKGGEKLVLEAELLPDEDWHRAEPVPFRVIYEDQDLLVIDKPAGIVVHPGAGNPSGTLVNGLLRHRASQGLLPRAGIIHRLDKDTSGLLLVAGSLVAHRALTKALQNQEISRRYCAITEGVMVAGRDIDEPIGRDPRQRVRQKVRADGKKALTRVRVRDRFRAHTLIRAELETGRTHQIRVHLSYIGHPLVGDGRYGARSVVPPGASADCLDILRGFSRQALHAERIGLSHPTTLRHMELRAEPPEDFRNLLRALRDDRTLHER